MKKLFAVLAVSTMIMPAIVSADAMDDAVRRGVCGVDVTPTRAEYIETDEGTTLHVFCPKAGDCTLCGTGLTGAGAGGALAALILVAALAGGDENGTTTTTTTSGN